MNLLIGAMVITVLAITVLICLCAIYLGVMLVKLIIEEVKDFLGW